MSFDSCVAGGMVTYLSYACCFHDTPAEEQTICGEFSKAALSFIVGCAVAQLMGQNGVIDNADQNQDL